VRVVLVHGLAGSSRWWRPVVGALESRHEVHLVDLPRARSLEEAVDRLASRIEDNIGRAAVVGHSMGGLLAATLATRRPDLVEKLVLVAPAGAKEPSSRRAHVLPLIRAVGQARPRMLAHLARDALRAGPRALWHSAGDVVRSTIGGLAPIEAPTLVVWGERDPLLPAERADLFASAIPGATVVVLPGAAHVPMFEAPEALSEVLLEFLD
jgi:pimeloyl-ACP methyl ester carboxylesterase